MKTLKVLTIVAITGLVGVVAVNANPLNTEHKTMCEKKKHHQGYMKEIFTKLDLTTEQQSAMEANRKEMREQRKAQRGKMHAERGMNGMSKFVSVKGFDKEGFMNDAMQKNKSRIEMRADRFEKTINILTEEQRVKFVELLQEKQK